MISYLTAGAKRALPLFWGIKRALKIPQAQRGSSRPSPRKASSWSERERVNVPSPICSKNVHNFPSAPYAFSSRIPFRIHPQKVPFPQLKSPKTLSDNLTEKNFKKIFQKHNSYNDRHVSVYKLLNKSKLSNNSKKDG
ncbi:hypothetical protein AZ46_0211515 [Metabacillus indicus LMG 22858]|nr:hypothetical protein AZ46_0211515 [Metabacillus indicus LMG 22858]